MQETVAQAHIYKSHLPKNTYGKNVILFFLSFVLVFVFVLSLLLSFFKDKSKQKLFDSKTYYYLCLESDENQKSAKEKAEKVKDSGGAGYVYFYNRTYNIVVFCYQNKSDVQKVINNNDGYNFQTLSVTTEKLKMKAKRKIKSDKTLYHSYEFICKSYEKLFGLFSELQKKDSGVIYEKLVKLKLEAEGLCSDLEKSEFKEQKSFKSLVLELESGLKIYVDIINEVLNEIYKNGQQNSVFALGLIKDVQMQVVLRQNLNKLW